MKKVVQACNMMFRLLLIASYYESEHSNIIMIKIWYNDQLISDFSEDIRLTSIIFDNLIYYSCITLMSDRGHGPFHHDFVFH